MDKRTGKASISGAHSQEEVQKHVLGFIQDAVLCNKCQKPETSLRVCGSRKDKTAQLVCHACGAKSALDGNDRFVKLLLVNPPEGCTASSQAHKPTPLAPLQEDPAVD